MSKTPIALFAYNRPEHTRTVLQSLSLCRRVDECSVRIYCDGAKSPAQNSAVAASREVAREWAWRFDAQIVERDQNIGLAGSIVLGVAELCEQHGRVIVIEDDFVLNPAF